MGKTEIESREKRETGNTLHNAGHDKKEHHNRHNAPQPAADPPLGMAAHRHGRCGPALVAVRRRDVGRGHHHRVGVLHCGGCEHHITVRVKEQRHTLRALMIVWMRVRRDRRWRHRRARAAVGRGRVRAGRRLHVRLRGCAGKRIISSAPSRWAQRGGCTYVASDPSRASTSLFKDQPRAHATRGVEARTIRRRHSRRVWHLHVRTLHVRAWRPRGWHAGHHVL